MKPPYYSDEFVTLYHGDAKDILPQVSQVDLLLTDPPYGINADKGAQSRGGTITGDGNRRVMRVQYPKTNWDNEKIGDKLLTEVIDKAKEQIIFGGNYYNLPPTSCWLVWDKKNGTTNFADCELAWTNLPSAVRLKRYLWNGMLREHPEKREHPTQKPLAVMEWAILKASNPQTILDPFAGSGTTLRAAKNLERQAIGIEREEQYCEIAAKRMGQEVLALGIE
mgnify:FL=1|tara:strand:+ start:571 stop:1239 length:669 start_codon:yes stop_codon:yes gene_type:complete